MKKILLPLTAICLLASAQSSFAQQKKKPQAPAKKAAVVEKKHEKKEDKPALNPEEMMKIWMEYATPSEVHKMLSKYDGDWNSKITQWMEPNKDPMKSEGKCNNKMIMGGRYQESHFSGNMMGMPFEGMSLLGYDNSKKMFISTWIDNMGTGIMTMEGKWDKETNTIYFKGKMVDPTTGGETPIREVFKFVDDNTQIMEMYAPNPDGKGEFKTMEIVFKR